jgi:hypothetical protein
MLFLLFAFFQPLSLFRLGFLKGTLARGFQLLFVLHRKHAPGFLIPTQDYFRIYKFDFTEIIEFEGHSAYYQNTQKEFVFQTRAK